MGLCCSCCFSNSDRSNNGNPSSSHSTAETELANQSASELRVDPKYCSKQVIICRPNNEEDNFSDNGCVIMGSGLALGSVPIEQDAAYWEFHILEDSKSSNNDATGEGNNDLFEALQFGVSRRPSKGQSIDKVMQSDGSSDESLSFLRSIPNLVEGDVVGVAVQQSDLPMVQFLVNGEPMHHMAINRIRGMVFPAICLCEQESNSGSNKGMFKVEFVFDSSRWKMEAPHPKFGAIIVARSIV